MADTLITLEIGPEDAGRRMSLEDFACAEGRAGRVYELERGVIVVVDVPGVPHLMVVQRIRNPLVVHQVKHPEQVFAVASGADCAVRMPDMESERHPDVAVYLTPPPEGRPQPWEYWTPDIVVEVVSPGGEHRDYGIKRDEYLRAGVRLYWVVNPQERSATVHRRRSDTWEIQQLDERGKLETPLLPGLTIQLTDVFPRSA